MNTKNNVTHLKREMLIRLIQAFKSENFEREAEKIPFTMRPKNSEVSYRCCIHKERAVLRFREIAALGFSVENDDEVKYLSEYAKQSLERTSLDDEVLTVIDTACKGCVPSRVFVTDLCQGCVARPCRENCSFGAITIKDGKSVIDPAKCKNCMKCVAACPYNAIVKMVVPCEEVCPVKAIQKNENGFAEIDFEKCINCGACLAICPFGAIAEKSRIIDILKEIKKGKKVVAILAPSVIGQLPATIGQISQGLVQAGFSDVYEAAIGADETIQTEAKEFGERVKSEDDFMTTSCCAAYREFVKKHAPELKEFISHTETPMHYTAKKVKEKSPENITVFIGPCVAKRKEALGDEFVDFVMSFEEMGALFVAMEIEPAACEEFSLKDDSSKHARNFGVSGGVTASVEFACEDKTSIKSVCINGLDKKTARDLKNWGKNKKCPDGNFVEVMVCNGGCVGGSSVLNDKKITSKRIVEYSDKAQKL